MKLTLSNIATVVLALALVAALVLLDVPDTWAGGLLGNIT